MFPTIYILRNIIYYIPSLDIIIVLAIGAVDFLKARRGLSYILAMYCGEIFFFSDFLLFQTKKLVSSWLKRWKEKQKNIELISRFKYAEKFSYL